MKKIFILALAVMMAGMAAAQEEGGRNENRNYAELRLYGGGHQVEPIDLSDFEVAYEHQFASKWSIGAGIRACRYMQGFRLTGIYHYTLWKGLGVVGGLGLGCTHASNSVLYDAADSPYYNVTGIGLQLELGLVYDLEKIPLRISVSLDGSRSFLSPNGFSFDPSFGVAYRF